MNYRHAYHAGNFADVLKHAVLALVIEYLKRKPAPFRVIDTHAGPGRYALASPEAGKTGEWRSGIARLIGPDSPPLTGEPARLLAPYLAAVRTDNPAGALDFYPGSPLIARRLLRETDTLIANELHPEDQAALAALFRRDAIAKVMHLDGWVALRSLLPPRERRGVVLIDPPFEQEGEFDRLAQGLADGLERFATGVYLAWYPIKDPKPVARFHRTLQTARHAAPLLCAELMIRRGTDPERLNGCGLLIANPPFTLEGELALLLPELARRLAADKGSGHRLDWLAQPTG